MKFGIVQKELFNAKAGSYSIVTEREVYDSQITATDAESSLLVDYYTSKGEGIHVGNVALDRQAAAKPFKLYPKGDVVYLNLVYPKPEKNELRLYLSSTAGFKPEKGMVWFLFLDKDDYIWIGAMQERRWREKGLLRVEDDYPSDVFSEMDSTKADDGEDVQAKTVEVKRWRRSGEIALKRMQLSKFKCEFDREHNLFIARSTGCPFLESHHVVPIRFQPHFKKVSLDTIKNLCCLCPNCHRAIHHSEESYARAILAKLAECRDIERNFSISLEDLFRLYSVEEIVR